MDVMTWYNNLAVLVMTGGGGGERERRSVPDHGQCAGWCGVGCPGPVETGKKTTSW